MTPTETLAGYAVLVVCVLLCLAIRPMVSAPNVSRAWSARTEDKRLIGFPRARGIASVSMGKMPHYTWKLSVSYLHDMRG
jgi:hypothetical protein